MTLRTLLVVGLVCAGLGAIAMWQLVPSTGSPDGPAPSPDPEVVATAGQVGNDASSMPEPVSAAKERRRKRTKPLPSVLKHNFEQVYAADDAAIEDGVLARASRFVACANHFGVPAGDEAEELPLVVAVSNGKEGGEINVMTPDADEGLADCLQQAVYDMQVARPRADGMSTDVYVPLPTE